MEDMRQPKQLQRSRRGGQPQRGSEHVHGAQDCRDLRCNQEGTWRFVCRASAEKWQSHAFSKSLEKG
jgi:hypothetical protein